jgi:hypothetical protein
VPTTAPGAAGPVPADDQSPGLTLYVREGCHLCDEFLVELAQDLGPAGDALVVRDVDTDPGLAARYGTRLPVLEAGGTVVCEGRYDRAKVLAALRV